MPYSGEEVGALGWGELENCLCDSAPEVIDVAGGGFAQDRLELGDDVLMGLKSSE
jgi:hypothetical protein